LIKPGDKGTILHRNGLYSYHYIWRKQFETSKQVKK